jgi:endonuclease/exonuclease/phosphatase family metal-dependent hydrolase
MKIKVSSFNLRCNTPHDQMLAWPYRREAVFKFLNNEAYDLIGFQEVTPDMLIDLKENLLDYHFFGIGRDQAGEAVIIAVHQKYEILASDTFWLSDTPWVESKISKSAFKRICTFVVLKEKEQVIACFNTHLDYQDGDAIYQQAEYLYHMMKRIKDKYNAHLILTGDFNQNPEDRAIRFLSTLLNHPFEDGKNLGLTYHGYSKEKEGLPIDYIFHDASLKMVSFSIRHDVESHIFLSDHYPIEADIIISLQEK